MKLREIYVSVDIEANGPIPGEFSMSSFGAFVAGGITLDGEYVSFDYKQHTNTFYAELKPISENYKVDAIKVGLLDGFDDTVPDPDGSRRFEWNRKTGQNPQQAMNSFASWVKSHEQKHDAPAIFMAYPLSFDWLFIYWYFIKFGVECPFGFSRAIDLKTLYAARTKRAITRSTKRYIPKKFFSKLPHTHKAVDDAIEQGIMGMNLLRDL